MHAISSVSIRVIFCKLSVTESDDISMCIGALMISRVTTGPEQKISTLLLRRRSSRLPNSRKLFIAKRYWYHFVGSCSGYDRAFQLFFARGPLKQIFSTLLCSWPSINAKIRPLVNFTRMVGFLKHPVEKIFTQVRI